MWIPPQSKQQENVSQVPVETQDEERSVRKRAYMKIEEWEPHKEFVLRQRHAKVKEKDILDALRYERGFMVENLKRKQRDYIVQTVKEREIRRGKKHQTVFYHPDGTIIDVAEVKELMRRYRNSKPAGPPSPDGLIVGSPKLQHDQMDISFDIPDFALDDADLTAQAAMLYESTSPESLGSPPYFADYINSVTHLDIDRFLLSQTTSQSYPNILGPSELKNIPITTGSFDQTIVGYPSTGPENLYGSGAFTNSSVPISLPVEGSITYDMPNMGLYSSDLGLASGPEYEIINTQLPPSLGATMFIPPPPAFSPPEFGAPAPPPAPPVQPPLPIAFSPPEFNIPAPTGSARRRTPARKASSKAQEALPTEEVPAPVSFPISPPQAPSQALQQVQQAPPRAPPGPPKAPVAPPKAHVVPPSQVPGGYAPVFGSPLPPLPLPPPPAFAPPPPPPPPPPPLEAATPPEEKTFKRIASRISRTIGWPAPSRKTNVQPSAGAAAPPPAPMHATPFPEPPSVEPVLQPGQAPVETPSDTKTASKKEEQQGDLLEVPEEAAEIKKSGAFESSVDVRIPDSGLSNSPVIESERERVDSEVTLELPDASRRSSSAGSGPRVKFQSAKKAKRIPRAQTSDTPSPSNIWRDRLSSRVWDDVLSPGTPIHRKQSGSSYGMVFDGEESEESRVPVERAPRAKRHITPATTPVADITTPSVNTVPEEKQIEEEAIEKPKAKETRMVMEVDCYDEEMEEEEDKDEELEEVKPDGKMPTPTPEMEAEILRNMVIPQQRIFLGGSSDRLGEAESFSSRDIPAALAEDGVTSVETLLDKLTISDQPDTAECTPKGAIIIKSELDELLITTFGSPRMEDIYKTRLDQWIEERAWQAEWDLENEPMNSLTKLGEFSEMSIRGAESEPLPANICSAVKESVEGKREGDSKKALTPKGQKLWDWVLQKYNQLIDYMKDTGDEDWLLLESTTQAIVYNLPYLKEIYGLNHIFTLYSISALGSSHIWEKLSGAKDGIRLRNAAFKGFFELGLGLHSFAFQSLHDDMDWSKWLDNSCGRYKMVLRRSVTYYMIVRKVFRNDSLIGMYAIANMMKALSKLDKERAAKAIPVALKLLLSFPEDWRSREELVYSTSKLVDAMCEVGMTPIALGLANKFLPDAITETFESTRESLPAAEFFASIANCHGLRKNWLQVLEFRGVLLPFYSGMFGSKHISTISCVDKLREAVWSRGLPIYILPSLKPEWKFVARVSWEGRRRRKFLEYLLTQVRD
ncbi:hypothetical protein AA313_de0206651 [Arthrobotrys entomopaga]|nr:hypothetical protein AA313_de0206651 [Arthrobotrys entomopaga]